MQHHLIDVAERSVFLTSSPYVCCARVRNVCGALQAVRDGRTQWAQLSDREREEVLRAVDAVRLDSLGAQVGGCAHVSHVYVRAWPYGRALFLWPSRS